MADDFDFGDSSTPPEFLFMTGVNSLTKVLTYTFFTPTALRIRDNPELRGVIRAKRKTSGKIANIAGYVAGATLSLAIASHTTNGDYVGLEVIAASQALSLGYEGLRKCRKYFSRKSDNILDELNRDVNSYKEK